MNFNQVPRGLNYLHIMTLVVYIDLESLKI